MAEFDDKLNSLLSNPEAMDQIMKMAQSLMGNGGGKPGTGGSPRNAAGVSGSAAPPPAQPCGSFGFPPQVGASGAGTPQSWPARPGRLKPISHPVVTAVRVGSQLSSPGWVILTRKPLPPSCRFCGNWEELRTAMPGSCSLLCGPI